jgi:hypothetical protein
MPISFERGCPIPSRSNRSCNRSLKKWTTGQGRTLPECVHDVLIKITVLTGVFNQSATLFYKLVKNKPFRAIGRAFSDTLCIAFAVCKTEAGNLLSPSGCEITQLSRNCFCFERVWLQPLSRICLCFERVWLLAAKQVLLLL